MAKRTKFEPTASGKVWMLNIPAKFSSSGKRERHSFPTKEKAIAAAKTYRKKREEFGHHSQAITPSLAESATFAAEILKPWNLSLVEAANIVVEIKKREAASNTLSAAGAAWLSACEGLRDRTKRNYRLTIERIEETLGTRIMSSIQADEIQAAVAPLGSVGAAAAERIRNAKAFWNWSAKKEWCNAVTFSAVEMPKASREDAEIGILTPAEVSLILTTAEKHFPQAVASFALQLFAGIRAEELVRLEAGHITKDGIELPATVTKKGRRRHITPSPTLSEWLKKYPFEPCANWRETSAAVRRLCGWEVSSVILNERIKSGNMAKLLPPTRGIWPQNALRHSHATYAVAAGVPLESLLFEFGHAGDPKLLRQHYVGRASKKQALEFFAIVPEGAKKPQSVQIANKGVA